jgi:four helix bundle protein
MGRGARRYTELRAWQACDVYKKAVYRLCSNGPLSRDLDKRRQIEKAVAGPPSHISEGFGRFNPPDFARYTVFAKSSLMESQNHLGDALDKGYIDEETRARLHAMAETALEEVGGLMDYLLSPEALRNARLARERRIARRRLRQQRDAGPGTDSNEDGKPESTRNRTKNRTANRTPRNRTPNPEL